MENFTYEQLVSILGQEAADEIQAQRDASSGSGGAKLPFTFLQKVSDVLGNELGNFSEFVVGAEKTKDDSGKYVWTNVGTNLGKEFQFVIVNVCYYYKKYVETDGQGKTFTSNIFKSLGELENVTDYSGNPLPSAKKRPDKSSPRKDAGWKLVRMNAGIVRKDDKSEFVPCIWEVDGTMLFGFNNIIDGAAGNGLLSGVMNVNTGHAKKGATPFVVLEDTSTFEPLPAGFWDSQANKEVISSITLKMKEYQEARSGSQEPAARQPVADETPTEGDTGGW